MGYTIEDVKVGVSEGGMACGPVSGNVIGELTLKDNAGRITYHCLADVEGMLNFYESSVSTYDGQLAADIDDGMLKLMHASEVAFYESSWELYDKLADKAKLSDTEFIRKLLTYLVREDWGNTKRMMKKIKGRTIGSFKIPVSSDEQEYLDDLEDEEEDMDEEGV